MDSIGLGGVIAFVDCSTGRMFPSLAINSTRILAPICGVIRAASRDVLPRDMQALRSQIIG